MATHHRRPTPNTDRTLPTTPALPAVATLPATPALPLVAIDPATPMLPAVAMLPATPMLPAAAIEPATPMLPDVPELPMIARPPQSLEAPRTWSDAVRELRTGLWTIRGPMTNVISGPWAFTESRGKHMNDHRRGRALRYAALDRHAHIDRRGVRERRRRGSSDTTAGTEAPAASEAPAATDAPADTEAATATDAPAESDAPDATDGATGTDAAEPAGEPEKADIKLGIIPIADVAPVFIGIEQGFFEEEGLTVSTEFAQGGAASIPSVVSGDIDFAFGAYPSFFSAVQEGLPLLISTEANRAAPLFGGLYALPDSGIATPADLEGKTIAVNTLNNLVQLAVEAQLVDAGLTLDDVTLVEIPFPDMVAALERGDVDVIAVVEPFGTIAKNSLDAVLVTDMFAGGSRGSRSPGST